MHADALLDRLEAKYGCDPEYRARLRPIVVRIMETDLPPVRRITVLRALVETYARPFRVREAIDRARMRLRQRVNELHAGLLGIKPTNLAS